MSIVLELVSPERLLLSESADMVVVPGSEGDFGILEGHAPLISGLRSGLLAVFSGGSVVRRFFIAGGFAEVSGDKCSVLVDSAFDFADLVESDIAREISDREDDVKLASGDDALALAEGALAIVRAKMEALKSPSY